MGSPRRSCGAAPLHPTGATTPRPHSEGGTAPHLAPGRLWCRAVLLLAICLSAHGLGSLGAPSPAHGDPRSHPMMEPTARVQMGAEGISGCPCGEENTSRGVGAAGLALGAPTGAVMLELGDSSVPTSNLTTSNLTTSSGFPNIQQGAPGAPARIPKGWEQVATPSPSPTACGVAEDLSAADPQPPEGTSSQVWAPPGTPWGLWSLGTAPASPPSPTSHGISHPQLLAPSEGFRGPAATPEDPSDPCPSPTLPALPPAPAVPTWTRGPSSAGPTEPGVSSAAPGAPEAPCEDGAAAVASWPPEPTGVTHSSPRGLPTSRSSPAGPPEPPPGSVPPPSVSPHAPKHPTSSPSPSHPPASTTPTPSSQTPAVPTATSDAQPVSAPSPATSWHPSGVPTAPSWVAAGEAPTSGAAASWSTPGLEGVSPLPVHTLPLSFRLLGISYSEVLSQKASGSYRQLEDEVRLMLSQALSTYETFLQANILGFTNGSVLVHGEVLFRGGAPSSSHLIRTLLTEASRGRDAFSWRLEPRSVQAGGFSLENLDPEKLSVSLTALQLGQDGAEALKRLVSEVTRALGALYPVRNFTVGHLRPLRGDLEITGDLYLDTAVHADVAAVLRALTALAGSSVDLSSLSVEGARLPLQVYPISFLITNRRFGEHLLDPLAAEHRGLARDLGDVVARALKEHKSFLQAVIRGFLPGSLLAHGDAVFQLPAPTSLEVLEALVLAVGPDETLAGSDFQVDPYSITVGEDALEPPPTSGFPEYAVAVMVVCVLGIVTVPIVVLVCLRTKRVGWSDVAVLWDRRDPEAGTQTLEMENQGFWVASDQDMVEAPLRWQADSA